MLFQAPLLTALLQLLRMSLRPHLLHLHPHIQLEGAPKVKAMPAILCSRSKPCELLGWSYVGLYHSHEALTTTQSGYGTVVMCDQYRVGVRWEQKRWSAGWMSAATTVVSKLCVVVHEKPAVRGLKRGLPHLSGEEDLWPARRGDTQWCRSRGKRVPQCATDWGQGASSCCDCIS